MSRFASIIIALSLCALCATSSLQALAGQDAVGGSFMLKIQDSRLEKTFYHEQCAIMREISSFQSGKQQMAVCSMTMECAPTKDSAKANSDLLNVTILCGAPHGRCLSAHNCLDRYISENGADRIVNTVLSRVPAGQEKVKVFLEALK